MNLTNQKKAIYSDSSYGPTFGGGADIYISDQCNENNSSFAYFPYSYNFA